MCAARPKNQATTSYFCTAVWGDVTREPYFRLLITTIIQRPKDTAHCLFVFVFVIQTAWLSWELAASGNLVGSDRSYSQSYSNVSISLVQCNTLNSNNKDKEGASLSIFKSSFQHFRAQKHKLLWWKTGCDKKLWGWVRGETWSWYSATASVLRMPLKWKQGGKISF